jgi:hypothetical protein
MHESEMGWLSWPVMSGCGIHLRHAHVVMRIAGSRAGRSCSWDNAGDYTSNAAEVVVSLQFMTALLHCLPASMLVAGKRRLIRLLKRNDVHQ